MENQLKYYSLYRRPAIYRYKLRYIEIIIKIVHIILLKLVKNFFLTVRFEPCKKNFAN